MQNSTNKQDTLAAINALVEIAYDQGFANGHGVGNQVGFVAGVMSSKLRWPAAYGTAHLNVERPLKASSASGSTSEKKYGSCADRARPILLLQVISLLSFMIEAQGSGASAVGQQPQGVEDDQQCGASWIATAAPMLKPMMVDGTRMATIPKLTNRFWRMIDRV